MKEKSRKPFAVVCSRCLSSVQLFILQSSKVFDWWITGIQAFLHSRRLKAFIQIRFTCLKCQSLCLKFGREAVKVHLIPWSLIENQGSIYTLESIKLLRRTSREETKLELTIIISSWHNALKAKCRATMKKCFMRKTSMTTSTV